MPELRRCAAGGVWDRSGGRFEGDLVAEGFELADVFALAAFDAEPVGEEVRAEVVEVGVGVGEQVPDDGQDRATDRDQGLLGPAAAGQPSITLAEEGRDGARARDRGLLGPAGAGQPSITLAEEGLGAPGADRGLAERAGQVAVAV